MDTSTLCDAVRGDNSPDQSLQRWRDAARHHLMSDPTGQMGRAHPALACSLPDSFPDLHVIDLYVKPAVTPLVELPVLHSPAPPDLAPLALLIHNLLGWDAKRLVSAFRSTVWPVVVLHEVLEDLAKNSPASDEVSQNFVFTCRYTDGCCTQFALAPGCTRVVFHCRARRPKKILAGVAGYDNDVPIGDLVRGTLQLLPDGSSSGLDDRTLSNEYIRVWMADQIYDCWVQTMFPSSPASASHAGGLIDLTDCMMPCPRSSAIATMADSITATSSSVGVIDLTGDEEEVIDLTGEDGDAEIIDLVL